ncbi:MAG: DNA mismatch repair endonuclease MutL [Candidatus Omnitrophica bacterium]|nr:DNA mismatch repair endonuclease MutL [Candidatus Omnitrophota bacterium]MBU1047213.1 DNA mismatch repair endonuclease MutL [Candidatus Omnitrophota bacterium]MBU1889513.1 DNA mismatch repair endonuclease MutL [Candidatus Omnitrophota bacterium]
MGKIRIPCEDTIKRIAAGEVIERPVSVIKELIENSLDADAKKITIELEEGGKRLIRVRDDGDGMTRDDAELCLERYSTSKIRDFNDLLKLSTLGFRGEALPSIATASQLSILTKSKEESIGILVEAENGKIKRITEQASPEGTTVTVKNLFSHLPARKKFLKNDSVELRHILNIVTREALARPKIAFQLFHNKKQRINTLSRNNNLDKIIDFWGKEFTSELIPLKIENSLFHIEGFISKPFFARRKSGMQYLFVNGRTISSGLIAAACKRGYQPVIPEERQPQVFLFLTIDPKEIDINVHPSKDIIKFQKENEIFEIIREGVRNCLKNAKLLPEIFFKKPNVTIKTFDKPYTRTPLTEKDKNTQLGFTELGGTPVHPVRNKILGDSVARDEIGGISNGVKEKREDYLLVSDKLNIKVQIKNTYLLGEDSEGVFMLDQHAAHERVLYEKLKKEMKTSTIQVQNLLIPETIELNKHEASMITENLVLLKNLGFNIEPFGQNTFIVHSVPKTIKKSSPSVIILDIAEEFENMDKQLSVEECAEKILTMVACKAAIKAGDKLTNEEIKSLINQWENTEYKNWCPHGRPAIIRFSWNEIEKRFNRKE